MTGPKFTARYPGKCPACSKPIEIGEELVIDEEYADMAVHADCAGRPDPTLPAREVCPRCFIERAVSGACGCEE